MSTIQSLELHVRTYRSALKSSQDVSLNSLTNSHLKIQSILHPLSSNPHKLDLPAFIYTLLRLPPRLDQTHRIVAAQTPEVFAKAGFKSVISWPRVSARSRRRTCHFDLSTKTLAVFIASITDIDDLANLLIAYQIEWNKLHHLLKSLYPTSLTLKKAIKSEKIATQLRLTPSDWQSFLTALGKNWRLRLIWVYRSPRDLRLRLLAGSWLDYVKVTQKWWKNIARTVSPQFHLSQSQIYFVSSNTHSLYNLLTGLPLRHQDLILDYLKANPAAAGLTNNQDLLSVWDQIQQGNHPLSPADFLYYASQFIAGQPKYLQDKEKINRRLGIITIPASHYLDINVQLIPIKSLPRSLDLDPRLQISKPKKLSLSDHYIFNIDYPLGYAAYNILSETQANVSQIRGLYILGKAAVLNGEIGDLLIPRLVFDEHTQNSYMFNNCFNTFFPFINKQGSVLTHQKAVSVLGTYLQNDALLKKYSQNNLTVIEMESGPYLGAVAEATYDQKLPQNTIVDLNSAPFDLGIINYASDTPYSQAKNLGSRQLTLAGVEPVYLGSLAILQRIIDLEERL